jgi:putative transcriptional regulator
MAKERFDFAGELEEALREALAWKRGELELELVEIDPMPAERVRAIRRKAARSAKAFERRFGISAATVQNWEQGRRQPDPAARLLLKVIEADADFVERIAKSA